MMPIIRAYQKLLTKYPLPVQAAQAGTLMALGDHIAQKAVSKKNYNELDWTRTSQFATIGCLLTGPATIIWYRILNKYVGSKGGTVALKKVTFDQIVFAPIFLIVLLSTIHTLQGKNLGEFKTKLKEEYYEILQNNYKIWPFVQLANFYFVPLHYQALVVQMVALLWNVYITYRTNIH
ncbi:protein Mpv17 [Prorops nasuta]|uniref:protein Mpv17 n=1 Tax=Prorops nasuta TaxID=863751 RepID=UPI0034CD237E